MKRFLIIIFFSLSFFCPASAQKMSAQEYVLKYKDLAIEEMKRMGVPAAITLAQGLLETENGNSDLLQKSNNHFGIKCKSNWTAETVSHDDDAPGECFRKYSCAEDSYRDHSNFLRGNARYAFLFNLDPTDYKDWAYGLRKAGYATNPRYTDILIKSIETYNLEQYTLEGIDGIPRFDASQYAGEKENIVPPNMAQNVVKNDPIPGTPISLTINGSKALLAAKGTSLLAIATEHHINLGKLLSINDLSNDGLLQKDQYVFLEKKQKEGKQDFCISQQNETLYDISQKYGVIIQNLYAYNNLTADDYLVEGTKIYLKSPPVLKQYASTAGQSQPIQVKSEDQPASSPGTVTHTVQPKESLYGISKKYDVKVDDIKKWNNLTSDNLHIGQQLIISK